MTAEYYSQFTVVLVHLNTLKSDSIYWKEVQIEQSLMNKKLITEKYDFLIPDIATLHCQGVIPSPELRATAQDKLPQLEALWAVTLQIQLFSSSFLVLNSFFLGWVKTEVIHSRYVELGLDSSLDSPQFVLWLLFTTHSYNHLDQMSCLAMSI